MPPLLENVGVMVCVTLASYASLRTRDVIEGNSMKAMAFVISFRDL